jgi:hypothetical protein
MELTASGRPFLYFPLRGHSEQQRHVDHRLRRYGAGRRMDFEQSEPDVIATALVEEAAGRSTTAGGDRRCRPSREAHRRAALTCPGRRPRPLKVVVARVDGNWNA